MEPAAEDSQIRLFLSQRVTRTKSGVPLSETSESFLNEKNDVVAKTKYRKSWFRQRSVSSPPFAKSENRQSDTISDDKRYQLIKQAAAIKSRIPGTRRYGTNLIPKQYPNSRVVYFKNLPENVGMCSIVAQVYGGPLSKISLTKPKLSSSGFLELYFIEPTRASKFADYASSGRFLINGVPYFPSKYTVFSRTFLKNEDLFDKIISKKKATRCLTIIFPTILTKRSSPFGESIRQDLLGLKGKFSKFGSLVAISPVMSKKIAVCIQFADIKDSIAAKQAFELRENPFQAFHGWAIDFTPDPTERPIPPLTHR